ncbi:hypothetical protein HanPSC8_Chr02g0079851 [Helianthus annuus]|nr:hypothetical protein HanPSC8_Chr02g0079851 [Helianthus annuus]
MYTPKIKSRRMTDVTAATIPTIIPVLFDLLLTSKSKLLWQKLTAHNLLVRVCNMSPSRPKTDEFRDNFVSQ